MRSIVGTVKVVHLAIYSGRLVTFITIFHIVTLFPQMDFSILTTNFLLTECTAQESVYQPICSQSAYEEDSIILECEYNTSSTNPTLQQHYDTPKYILLKYTFGDGNKADEFKGRFLSSLNSTSRSVPLTIQNLCVSDSL